MTVRQLLASCDSRELAEWMAYEQVEPFGDARGDLQAGVVASTIANVNRGKRAKSYKPQDFLLQFRKPQAQSLSAEATLAAAMAAFGVVGEEHNASGQGAETGTDPGNDEDAE